LSLISSTETVKGTLPKCKLPSQSQGNSLDGGFRFSSLYTHYEQVLRTVRSRSELNQEVLVLFIRTRIQAINCSSLELKVFFFLWDLWLVFCSTWSSPWRILCQQREGNNSHRLHATPLSFKLSLQRDSEEKR
jgi:hypothetical protein